MYDIFTIIELVESKPCLWDKTIEDYKNKVKRSNAWREICLFLEPEFEGFDEKKKDEILNTITHKWNNTRDYFMKSLKKKSGQAQKKQYIYHKQLQFLLKTIKEDSTISNLANSSLSCENESRPGTSASLNPSQNSDNEPRPGTSATSLPISEPESSLDDSSAARIHKKKRLNPVDEEILKALKSQEPRQDDLEDDDKAFFMSILPTVKRIPVNDRLEFRIDVMQLLRKYTNRIRTPSFSSVSSSPLPPSRTSVNFPNNEVTPSPPHLPQIENRIMHIYSPSPSSSSPLPPSHTSVNFPNNEVTPSPPHLPQIENRIMHIYSPSPSSSSPLPPSHTSVNFPNNEVTPSPPHLPQIENRIMHIYSPSPSSSSPLPPSHTSVNFTTNEDTPSPPHLLETENLMTAPPVSIAVSVSSLRTITELIGQHFENY